MTTSILPRIISWLSTWTVDHSKCWFEYHIHTKEGTKTAGAFGTYRQEAIRYAGRKVGEAYPGIRIPVVEVEFSPPVSRAV